jgi:hypothetical protein
MTKGEAYRLRAKTIARRIKGSSRTDTAVLEKKKKALDDMTETEDWLDGKPGARIKTKKATANVLTSGVIKFSHQVV